jgi:hypothetical protein
MTTYTVTVERTITQTATIELEAPSPEDAEELAQTEIQHQIDGETSSLPPIIEWELEDDRIEVINVDEA